MSSEIPIPLMSRVVLGTLTGMFDWSLNTPWFHVFILVIKFLLFGGARNNTLTVTEVVVQRYSVKKVFLKISQNSHGNTCTRVSFLIKLQASGCNFIKKESLA